MLLPTDDRRRFPRVNVQAPIEFYHPENDEIMPAHLLDLSGGGASFQTQWAVTAGDEIELRIKPELSITPGFRAKAYVIRCTPFHGEFRVACEIRGSIGEHHSA